MSRPDTVFITEVASGGGGLEEEQEGKATPSVEGAEAPLWGDGADRWVPSRLV